MTCISHVVTTRAALAAQRHAMATLAERHGASSGIVQHPDWIEYELDRPGGPADPHIVTVTDGDGSLLGYVPLLAVQHTARVNVGGRGVGVYRGQALRLLGSGVVADQPNRAQVAAVAARQLADDPAARVLRIQEAWLPDALAAALDRWAGYRIVHANLLDQVHWLIDGQPSSDAWLAGMDRKRRGDLVQRVGRTYRKLGGDAALHTYDTPEQIPVYAALMSRLYPRTWHHAAHPMDWQEPSWVALLQRLSAAGHFIGHLVLRNGEPLAYVHGYRASGRYLVDDLGYDEAVARVGIGSVAVFQAVRGMLDRYPGEAVSFGYGDNQYKRLLATRSEACASLYAVRPQRATAGFGVYRPARWLYQGLHRMRNEWKEKRRA